MNYAVLSFWGEIFQSPVLSLSQRYEKKEPFIKSRDLSVLNKANNEPSLPLMYNSKPPLLLALNTEKMPLVKDELPVVKPLRPGKEPEIILYPFLPYSFRLYFKDRPVAHVEIIFNIFSQGKRSYVVLKRKISSGNLDADLLSLRYIGHYLFIRQAQFPHNLWQTVKIDLSAKQ